MLSLLLLSQLAAADPCGMVPPAWIPDGEPGIVRVGDQITYSFFDQGVQTIAIRPGFTGKVHEFGMLVPFPSPPSMKKMNDATFTHLEAAVDPPILQVHLYDNTPRPVADYAMAAPSAKSSARQEEAGLRYNEVKVVSQEAIGMYEIAVLEAGSPKALERWMTHNDYKYPDGMDAVVGDYVDLRWVFVAVKAKVGQMPGVTPKPGMRSVTPDLPPESTFDGHVQGMVFRFEIDEPVVPMRLSTFNGENARNLVYMLTEGGVRIDGLKPEFVVRQVRGGQLLENLTGLIPVQIHNGTRDQIPKDRWTEIDQQRDPAPYSGVAREQFASDLLAAKTKELVLPYEKEEKELLNLNEAFGIRGEQGDALLHEAVGELRAAALQGAVRGVANLTLTVIDGELPTEHLRDQNLTFSAYRMPDGKNTPENWTRRPAGPTVWVPYDGGGGGWFR